MDSPPLDGATSPRAPISPRGEKSGYRVLHSADWHLGKKLGDYSRHVEHQRFLDWLLQTIRTHEIDALVVAGDIFDSARPPQDALQQYYDFLAKLYRETCGACRVIITAGNHDSPSQLEAPRDVLKALNAVIVGEMPQDAADAVVPLPDEVAPEVIVAAIPFLRDRDLRSGRLGQSADQIQKDLRDGIAASYRRAADACAECNANAATADANAGRESVAIVALGHLTVKGATDSDSEREIHIGGLGSVACSAFPEEFDYVALGHLHRPQTVNPAGTVCYSGSPIALSFSEANDIKTVRILEFTDGKLVGNETLAIPVSRHLAQLRTDLSQLEETIRDASPPTAELPTWVELVVDTSDASEDITKLAREFAAEQPFEVIRVIRKLTASSLHLSSEMTDDSIDHLLDDPAAVFDQLLSQQNELPNEELAALRTLFAELRDVETDSLSGLEPVSDKPNRAIAS